MRYQNDQELFALMKEKLYTAVCCDVMDDLGYWNQAMRHDLRPVDNDMVVVGRAKTVLAPNVYKVYENPYKIEIDALDSVKEGEVVVVSTNNSTTNGIWGELMSTATVARGGTGAIVEGMVRDIRQIKKMNFPLFAVGYKPVDSKGRGYVIDYDCPVDCGGVRVKPGDVVFGDIDGAIVIPKEIADDVIRLALEKVSKEKMTKNELLEGKYLKDVYAKFGVL